MTKLTRYARFEARGWLAMNTNVDPQQATRRGSDLAWGEEEAVYVPNVLAANSPALLKALHDLIRACVPKALPGEREMGRRAPDQKYIDRARAIIARVEEGS